MEPMDRRRVWGDGVTYENYMGRWSRLIGREFLKWLAVPTESRWLDVGCGTGELSRTILDTASPRKVCGVDPSEGFVAFARERTTDERASFHTGDATRLPFESADYDAAVSGLALNFVPDPEKAAWRAFFCSLHCGRG